MTGGTGRKHRFVLNRPRSEGWLFTDDHPPACCVFWWSQQNISLQSSPLCKRVLGLPHISQSESSQVIVVEIRAESTGSEGLGCRISLDQMFCYMIICQKLCRIFTYQMTPDKPDAPNPFSSGILPQTQMGVSTCFPDPLINIVTGFSQFHFNFSHQSTTGLSISISTICSSLRSNFKFTLSTK